MCSLRVDRTHLQLFTLRSLCCAVSLSLWVILQKCNSCLLSNFALTRQMERCVCKRNVTAGLGLYVLRFLWRNDNFYDVKTNVKSWHLKVSSHDLCMYYALAYVHRPGQPVNMSMHINFPFRLPSSFLQHLVSKTNGGRQTQSMLMTTRPAQMIAEQVKQDQMNIKRCVQPLAILCHYFVTWYFHQLEAGGCQGRARTWFVVMCTLYKSTSSNIKWWNNITYCHFDNY